MPKVMLRRNGAGELTCYVPKKDLEGKVVTLEHDTPERWGGRLGLDNGAVFYIEPLSAQPTLPIEVRARRVD
ncbi:MAG: putative nitrogen fixation protein NifT [Magnetococcales bacterium]|nr:putative nitrogen fixation protein NifT [Magnetococcales bacterium]